MAEGAPSPAETEAAAQEAPEERKISPEAPVEPETVVEQPPESIPAAPTPSKPRPRWQFWRREQKPLSPAEEERRDFEQEDQKLTSNWRERLKTLDKDPESLIHFLSLMNAREYQEYRIEEKHGKTLSKFRKVTKGDLTFELTKEGQVRYNIFRELANRAARVFDKETLMAIGLYGTVGIMMGGFGIPGLAALTGKIGGRAAIEVAAAVSGHEREAQRNQTALMVQEWAELTALAGQYQNEKANLSIEQQAEMQTEIINRFYIKSENMVRAEAQLTEREEVWKGRRDKMGKVLSFVGGATGLVTGLTGLTNMIEWGNMDGDKVHHAIRMVDGKWQFAYNAGERFAKTATELGKITYHAMGPNDGWKIMGNVAAGLAGVFGGFKLGELLNRNAQKDEEMLVRQAAENRAAQREAMLGAVPRPEPMSEPRGPGSATEAVPSPEAPSPVENTRMPSIGEIWEYTMPGQERSIIRIKSMDATGLETASCTVEFLDYAESGKLGGKFISRGEGTLTVEDIMQNGRKRSEVEDHWRKMVQNGFLAEIPAERFVDQANPKKEKTLAEDEYEIYFPDELADERQALLINTKSRYQSRVNIFDLAWDGLQTRKERPKEETKKTGRTPKNGDFWQVKPNTELKGDFANLLYGFEVRSVDEDDGLVRVYKLNEQGKRENDIIYFIPLSSNFAESFIFARSSGGGGEQEGGGGGQRRQRRR